MANINSSRTKQHVRTGLRTLLDPVSTWAFAWDFSEAPETGDIPAFVGPNTLSPVGSAWTKGYGTDFIEKAIGANRVDKAVRLTTGDGWNRSGLSTTSVGIRVRFIGRFPEVAGAIGFFWGNATGSLEIEKLGTGRGVYQFTLVQDSAQQDQRTIDIGSDGWVLIDAFVAPSGSDIEIAYAVNGTTDSDTLTSVTYTGFPADFQVGDSSFIGGDVLFVGVEQTNSWAVADHTRDYNRSGLDFTPTTPTDFAKVSEVNRLDIPNADVSSLLDDSENVVISTWARRSRSKDNARILGVPGQLEVYTQEPGLDTAVRLSGPSRKLIEGYEWTAAWDFSQAPSTSGDVPAYAGGVDLTLESGTYTDGQSTGSFNSDAITSSRVDSAIDPSSGDAEFGATGGVLSVSSRKRLHIRLIAQFEVNGDLLNLGLPGGRRFQVISTASTINARFINDAGSQVLNVGPISNPSVGDWMILDCIFWAITDDRTGGQIFLNGTEGNVFQTSVGNPFLGVEEPQIDILHYNGGNNSDSNILFAGFREVDDFTFEEHEADFNFSGLADGVFDTYTWDYAWDLTKANTSPSAPPTTGVVAAYAGSVDLDLEGSSASPHYITGLDTGPIRNFSTNSGVEGNALAPSETTRARLSAIDSSIISSTGYHMRVIAQMPTYSNQSCAITVGDRTTSQYMYIYTQSDLPFTPDWGRVILRPIFTGVSGQTTRLEGFRLGEWLLIDAWYGVDPNNSSQDLRVLMVNGRRLEENFPISSYGGPTSGRIDVGHLNNQQFFDGPMVFAAARRTTTPPTLEDHTRDWINSGIGQIYENSGSSADILSDGNWHHLGFLYRRNKEPLVALDGKVVASSDSIIPYASLPASTEDFRLGGDAIDLAKFQILSGRNFEPRHFAGLYRAASELDPSVGFAGQNDTDGVNSYYNALDSLTGLNQVGDPIVLNESDPELLDGYDWLEAWTFDTVPSGFTDGRTRWDSSNPDFYDEYPANTANINVGFFTDDSDAFTMEFWYRSPNSPPASGSEKVAGRSGHIEVLKFDDTGTTKFRVQGAGFTWNSDNAVTELDDGSWHHYVATFEYGGTLEVYVDGTAEAGTLTGAIPATIPSGGTNFEIGDSAGSAFDIARLTLSRVKVNATQASTLHTDTSDRRQFNFDFLNPDDVLFEVIPGRFNFGIDGYYLKNSSVTTFYANTISSAVGGTDLGLISGGFGDERTRASLSDEAIGSFTFREWGKDSDGYPIQGHASGISTTTGQYHLRVIARVNPSPSDGNEAFLVNYGQLSSALFLSARRRINAPDNFLINATLWRNNSQLFRIDTGAGSPGEYSSIDVGDFVLIDVVVGPDDAGSGTGSSLKIFANGQQDSLTHYTNDFLDPADNDLFIGTDRSTINHNNSDILFVGIREGDIDLDEHIESVYRFKLRSKLFSGWYWDRAWDFGELTSNSQDPVPSAFGPNNLSLDAGAYTITDIDDIYDDPTFGIFDIGPRTTYALFGASGALLSTTDSWFQREVGVHIRIVIRATGSAVTLLSLSAATNPSLTLGINSSGHVFLEYNNGSNTYTATCNAGLVANEWAFIQAYIQSDGEDGMRMRCNANNTTQGVVNEASVPFEQLGTNTIEIGGSNGTADSDNLGVMWVSLRDGRGADLLSQERLPGRLPHYWRLAYRGSDATTGSWAPWIGSGPTLTGTGTSTLDVSTGLLSERDLLGEVNKAVKRVSGSSHAASSGFTYPPIDQDFSIRCIFRPTSATQPSGQVVWALIEQIGAGADRYIGLRRTSGGFQLDFYTEDPNNPGSQLTGSADSITISNIEFDEWNMVDIIFEPDTVGGDITITTHVNGVINSGNDTIDYDDPTFGAANVGIGLLNTPDGNNALNDAELLFWGLKYGVISANDHRNDWQGSSLQEGEYYNNGWHINFFSESNL